MLLNKIRASGIKGQDFDYDLGAGTAIIGPNSAGKTAIVEAIKFVCRGKFPEVKKGSWPEATVVGEFDFGAVTRSINSKGTVSNQIQGSGNIDLPGLLLSLDTTLMEPETYFWLTDRERTNYVFERVKLPDSFTVDAIAAEIQRLSLGEKHTEEVEKAKQDIIVEVRSDFNNPTIQESLASAVETCRTRFTYWNKRAKETQGAVTTLTELKLREKDVRAAPAAIEQQIDGAMRDLSALNQERGALQAQVKEAENTIATRLSLQKYLNADRIDYDAMLAKVRARRLPIAQEFERINEELEGIDTDTLKRDFSAFELEHKKHSEAAAIFDDTCADIAKSIEDLEKQDHCPYCQAKEKGWKETARVRLKEKLGKATKAYRGQLVFSKDTESRKNVLAKRIQAAADMAVKASALKVKLKTDGDEIDRLTAEKDRDTKRRAEWKERLEKMDEPRSQANLKTEIAEVEKKMSSVKEKLDAYTAVRTAETKLQHDLVRAGEAAKEHELAAAQVTVTKAVGKLLDQKRTDMVAEVFNNLLKTANAFTKGILKSPLTLTDGTIGRWDGPTFIEHRWFGGTEKALTYIAISIALSAAAPFKLVILDEFGRLDQDNQVKVIDRLLEMQKAEVIDQFIIAGTNLPFKDKAVRPLNVIRVK